MTYTMIAEIRPLMFISFPFLQGGPRQGGMHQRTSHRAAVEGCSVEDLLEDYDEEMPASHQQRTQSSSAVEEFVHWSPVTQPKNGNNAAAQSGYDPTLNIHGPAPYRNQNGGHLGESYHSGPRHSGRCTPNCRQIVEHSRDCSSNGKDYVGHSRECRSTTPNGYGRQYSAGTNGNSREHTPNGVGAVEFRRRSSTSTLVEVENSHNNRNRIIDQNNGRASRSARNGDALGQIVNGHNSNSSAESLQSSSGGSSGHQRPFSPRSHEAQGYNHVKFTANRGRVYSPGPASSASPLSPNHVVNTSGHMTSPSGHMFSSASTSSSTNVTPIRRLVERNLLKSHGVVDRGPQYCRQRSETASPSTVSLGSYQGGIGHRHGYDHGSLASSQANGNVRKVSDNIIWLMCMCVCVRVCVNVCVCAHLKSDSLEKKIH